MVKYDVLDSEMVSQLSGNELIDKLKQDACILTLSPALGTHKGADKTGRVFVTSRALSSTLEHSTADVHTVIVMNLKQADNINIILHIINQSANIAQNLICYKYFNKNFVKFMILTVRQKGKKGHQN